MPSYQALLIGRGVTLKTPTADGTNGQALITNGSGVLSFSTVTTNPAGSDTELQFNNAGAFGASSLLTFNGNTLSVTAGDGNGAAAIFKAGSSLGRILEFQTSAGGSAGGIRCTNTNRLVISRHAVNNWAQVEIGVQGGDDIRLNTIQGSSYFQQDTTGATFKHGSAVTAVINSGGMTLTGQNTANPVFQVNMPASHADNAWEVRDSTTATIASMNAAGRIDWSALAADAAILKARADAITIPGTVSHQIAVDIGGTIYYLVAYTHGT